MMRGRIDIVCILNVVLTVACLAGDGQTNQRGVSILREQDNACGPKCLWALTQLTAVGHADVNDIYRLMNRPISSAVNLKDLKDAAGKLGFVAEGRRLKPSDLASLRGYAILPVGKTTGTEQEPLHFVLIVGAKAQEIAVIDTAALTLEVAPLTELTKIWAGPALVISNDTQGNQLSQPLTLLSGARARGRQIVDLGTVEVGTNISRSLVVSGTDDRSEWRIVAKSCHCLEAELSRDAAGHVVLSAHLEVKTGGLQVQFIAVGSEQAGVRTDYQFRVFGKNAHRIAPDNGYLQAHEGRTEFPVTIHYYPGDTSGPVLFDGIRTSIANLQCGDPSIAETIYGDARAVTISVPLIYTLTDGARGKTFNEEIAFRLKTSAGERSFAFPLTVKAGDAPLRLIPESLLFLCSKSSTSTTQKTVKVSAASTIPEAGLSITPEAPIQMMTESRPTNAGDYLVDVSIKPSALAAMPIGVYRGKLTIAVAGGGGSPQLPLPVTIAVRE